MKSLVNLKNYCDRHWGGYVLECARDGAIYVGISTDIDRRLHDHMNANGSRFTKFYGPPVKVLELFFCKTGEEARKWEKETALSLQSCYRDRPVYHPDNKPRLWQKHGSSLLQSSSSC